jgi:hypothetical protein
MNHHPIKGKLMSTVVGIKSSSSLEVMPVHTTLYHGAQTKNPQVKCLMEPMVSTKLNILHKGKDPAIVISNMKEVINLINLTLGTDMREDLVSNHMYLMKSLSDHQTTHI